MSVIYSSFFCAGLLATSPYWLWRAAKKNELSLTAARLGWTAWPLPAGMTDPVWFHAVSVGEVQAASPLIRLIRERRPDRAIALSVTTRTGMEVARKLLNGISGVTGPLPFPLDVPWAVHRRLREIRPQAIVLIDTELWPNLISSAARRGTRIFVANGRISDKSFPRYRAIRRFLRPMLQSISVFWMQSDVDAERIAELGAPTKNIRVPGNLKIDALALSMGGGDAPARAEIPSGAPVVLAASTHPGEEAMILEAAGAWKSRGHRFHLAIAPRHPERAGEVQREIESAGFRTVRRSEMIRRAGAGPSWPDGANQRDVLLIDTIGELTRFFPRARVVFVGGSLVPRGGHNIFEPAAFGRPVVFGSHMENFREADQALNGRGGRKVFSADELSAVVESMLDNPALAESTGRTARETFESLKGAAGKIIGELLEAVDHGRS